MTGWRRALDVYTDKRVLMILPLGFSSGLPLLLTYTTLSAWLATEHISRAAIGAFALVGIPYALKFLWSPLIDRLPPPIPIGRRRGWGITIQLLLIAAVLALGSCHPTDNLPLMAGLALLVAFLSASQDIVIDAYRVEILKIEEQGPGAAFIQTGYRVANLVTGAGALLIADHWDGEPWRWLAAYGAMAALLSVGLAVFIFGPEPEASSVAALRARESFGQWLKSAVIDPFVDFMQRPIWPALLIFVFAYKLGEAMAGVMATPLYVSIGFSLSEIAAVSKLFGFFATIAGVLLGGLVTARLGIIRALLICGVLQSLGNLAYVLQATAGHRLDALALCVVLENVTGGMAGTAMIAYLSSLCSPAFTATQYALLSSIAVLGRTVIASSGGVLADMFGWVDFFLMTTVVTIPALLLLLWMGRRERVGLAPTD